MLREPPYDDGAGRDDDDGDAAPSVTDILRAALEPVAAQNRRRVHLRRGSRAARPSAHGDIDIMIIGRGIDYTDVIPHFIAAAKYLGARDQSERLPRGRMAAQDGGRQSRDARAHEAAENFRARLAGRHPASSADRAPGPRFAL